MNQENNLVATQQEKYFLNTFPLINRIVLRRSGTIPPRLIDDLIQQVKFKLWRWKSLNQEKELSLEEWQRLAYTATNSEITDYYRRKENQNILFSDLSEESLAFEPATSESASLEGESQYESRTLLLQIWEKFQQLSLRQKYAFLFYQSEFIDFLLKFGCCRLREIADSLILSENEFVDLLENVPLKDPCLQKVLAKKIGEQLTLEQIWTARYKAKTKLLESVKG